MSQNLISFFPNLPFFNLISQFPSYSLIFPFSPLPPLSLLLPFPFLSSFIPSPSLYPPSPIIFFPNCLTLFPQRKRQLYTPLDKLQVMSSDQVIDKKGHIINPSGRRISSQFIFSKKAKIRRIFLGYPPEGFTTFGPRTSHNPFPINYFNLWRAIGAEVGIYKRKETKILKLTFFSWTIDWSRSWFLTFFLVVRV